MAGKGLFLQSKNLTDNLSGGVYVALYSNSPGSDDVGDEIEGYARPFTSFSTPKQEKSEASSTNSQNVVFPGKSGGYGTITHVALKDASTGGNLLYYAELSEPIRSKSDKAIDFPVGSLKVSES